MFGGYGIYRDRLMLALVADKLPYLNVDDCNRQDFIDRGLETFFYDKGGRRVSLSYHRAPYELMDDLSAAAEWAGGASEAAAHATRAGSRRRR